VWVSNRKYGASWPKSLWLALSRLFDGATMKTEPALILGTVQAILALVVSFGVGLTAEQIGAIMAAAAMFVALLTRHLVYSPATVEAKMASTKAP
jgi:hypothetical protein